MTLATTAKGVSPDFKKIKAKVGKRAPKKLNATDTSFQSSKVQVRPQQLQTSSSSVDDGRKKEIEIKAVDSPNLDHTFISQINQSLSVAWIRLNHPASPVRVSVLETVRGILFTDKSFSWNSSPVIRRQFPLAIVLPPLFKCLVDEEAQVRTLAISLLVDVVGIFHNNTLTTHTIDVQLPFKPFVPLFLAYILSAFHSLDPDIRYHGCIAFHLLSANFQSLLSNLDYYFQEIPSILSAYVTLLADMSMTPRQAKSTGNNKNRKSMIQTSQTKSCVTWIPATTPKSVGVLQSFQSFLDVVSLHEPTRSSSMDNSLSNQSYPAIDPPHFRFTIGGHKSNAILFHNSPSRHSHLHSVPTLNTWEQAVHVLGRNGVSKFTYSSKKGDSSTLLSTVTQVLEKLRDRFVEVIQYDDSTDIRVPSSKRVISMGEGIYIPDAVLDEIILLLNSFRKVWLCWCQQALQDDSSTTKHSSEREKSTFHSRPSLIQVIRKIFTLLLESFPFKSKHSSQQGQQIHTVNATMACFIFDLGHSIPSEKVWLEVLFRYCKSYLEINDCGNGAASADTPGESHLPYKVQLGQSHIPVELESVLDIVGRLVLLADDSTTKQTYVESARTDDIKERWSTLFAQFGDLFFPMHHPMPPDRIIKSNSGRKAVGILISLLNQNLNVGIHIKSTPRLLCILERMTVLPLYLVCWSGDRDYQNECTHVLAVFYSIARHGFFSSSSDANNSDFTCLSLQGNVATSWKKSLLLLQQSLAECEEDGIMNGSSSRIPSRNELPLMGQRLLSSILGTL